MLYVLQNYLRLLDRFVCFTVLGGTFFLCCTIMSAELGNNLFLQILAYASIISIFISLSRRALNSYCQSIGIICHLILGNAIGIVISSCIMLLLGSLFLDQGVFTFVITVSGIMAFFILGVFCPLIHEASHLETTRSSYSLDSEHVPRARCFGHGASCEVLSPYDYLPLWSLAISNSGWLSEFPLADIQSFG